MLRSTRYATSLVVALGLLVAVSSTSLAQKTPAARADQLNNEGKGLFRKGDLSGAANKFRQAIVFSPEGRFYFNLCYVLNKLKRHSEALTACQAVKDNGASAPLLKKTNKLLEAIRPKVRTAPPPPPPPNTGDTGSTTGDGGEAGDRGNSGAANSNGDGATGNPPPGDPDVGPTPGDPATGGGAGDGGGTGGASSTGGMGMGMSGGQRPPDPIADAAAISKAAQHADYKWALGFEIAKVTSNLADGRYADTGLQLKLNADFVLSAARKIGVRGYLNLTQIAEGDTGGVGEPLEIFDVGGAVFQHRRIKQSNFYWTPLVGAHISLMQPEALADGSSLAALGFRGEVSLAYVLGNNKQHAITASAGLNLYMGAGGGGAALDPADYGLDTPGSTFGFGIGYTLRFTSAFGSAPIFTLE